MFYSNEALDFELIRRDVSAFFRVKLHFSNKMSFARADNDKFKALTVTLLHGNKASFNYVSLS